MVNSPFSNVDPNYVNVDNSHDPAVFSSNKIPTGIHTLSNPYTSNILAAKASSIKGGKKKKYKSLYMKKRSRKSRSRKTRRRRRRQRGGYSQYQNNLPLTQTYALASKNISASDSALANPPPYKTLSNCTNCVDNYNYNTNKGFASKGH
jgi:hypothetical protein